jgi:hypothetical protein
VQKQVQRQQQQQQQGQQQQQIPLGNDGKKSNDNYRAKMAAAKAI